MLERLAREGVGRFGPMRGRAPGLSSWSAYTTLHRVDAQALVDQVVAGLLRGNPDPDADEPAVRRRVQRRVDTFGRLAEADARRRIAEDKGPEHMARHAVRPPIEDLDFLSARRSDLEEMRRQIHPLARRLATRLTREHHARRRGPLDFRRTVRASISTGGVPMETRHKPKRPGRTDLVVLCDVSGSVANFAQFTLMLVFALREQFNGVRAFTFVDDVHEVTDHFRPGADPVDTMLALAASAQHATLWGRTNYGRAFQRFSQQYGDALNPTLEPARARRRAVQPQRPRAVDPAPDGVRRPARLVAQPGARAALGHRRLRRRTVRRAGADGRVPQPHPARRVRARPRRVTTRVGPCLP